MDKQENAERTVEQVSDADERIASALIGAITMPDRWLRILQSIMEGALAHLELHALLRETLSRVREAMEAENAVILLATKDGHGLNVYAARGPEEAMSGQMVAPMGHGVAGTIVTHGKTLIINDLSQVEEEDPPLHGKKGSLLGAPLRVGDNALGVLFIKRSKPHSIRKEEGELLHEIAGRVAVAIEHAQMYEAERTARQEAQALVRHLQTLQTVSEVAMDHAPLQDLLQALLQRLQQVLEVDNVAILLPTPDGESLKLYSVRGPERAVMGKVFVPMGQGVAGTIAATRKPLIVDNLASAPVSNPFLKEHFHSLLGVPLLDEGRLIGVIHVDSVQPRRFTEEESLLLQALAERIAAAITHAQEYEHEQRGRAEAERQIVSLQETTERMDEFLGIASHELRTPLTSLAMNIQILDQWLNSRRGRRQDESDAEYMARAFAAARPLVQRTGLSIQRLDHLINDLLDASRIRETQLPLRRQRTDLVALVREIVEEQTQAYSPRTVRLEARGPVEVEADTDRIGQVVSNYVSNALKYSPAEQPIAVTVQAEVEHGQARVSVHDEGVGISEAEMEHIWNRFYRAPGIEHQSGSQVGLGLGLYICRDIIERHGGTVGVESTPGIGSTFWFTLPLASV